MNAPDPHVLPAVFPLVDLLPSPTNPRKHFDEAALAELAKSIQEHGVLQPILLRRWQHLPPRGMTIAQCCDKYEIVAGERRWRAARLAGIDAIPGHVRDLDDKAVLETQLVENLQRDDLHELEEADGYRQMIDRHGYTAETIAAKIGQSKSYVYARLKLCALIPAGREACFAGKLDASHALLIARMPETLQAKALKEILDGSVHDPMSYRAAARLLQTRYMLRLERASFPTDDAELLPVAGPCGTCPKRTGAQPELFADVGDADVCTDPDCFNAKKLAHTKAQIEKAKADGRRVIDGAEAKKAMPNTYGGVGGDFVELDARCYDDPKSRTYRQLLGKDAKAPEILVDPHDKSRVIEVMPRATIAEHLADKGIAIATSARGNKSDEERARERKRKIEQDYRGRVFGAVRSALTLANEHARREYDVADWTLVAGRMFVLLDFESRKKISRLWYGPDAQNQEDHALAAAFAKRIETLSSPDCSRLILEMALIDQTFVSTYASDYRAPRLTAFAERVGIDHAALKKAAQSDARAKEKAKSKPAAKSAAKTVKTKSKAPDATATLSPIALGQRVVIKPGATWPDGKKIKDAGAAGTVESQTSGFWNVRLDDNGLVTHLASTQLTAAETAFTPESAARASGKGATKAAPADGKTPTPAAAKKPRGKTGSATAAPSNEESTAAAEAGASNAAPAAKFADSEWPFPFPTRKS